MGSLWLICSLSWFRFMAGRNSVSVSLFAVLLMILRSVPAWSFSVKLRGLVNEWRVCIWRCWGIESNLSISFEVFKISKVQDEFDRQDYKFWAAEHRVKIIKSREWRWNCPIRNFKAKFYRHDSNSRVLVNNFRNISKKSRPPPRLRDEKLKTFEVWKASKVTKKSPDHRPGLLIYGCG